MNIIGRRKIYFTISGLFVAASIVAIAVFGLKYGIDFTGGSLLEIKVNEKVQKGSQEITEILTKGDNPLLPSVLVQATGDRGFLLRFQEVSEETHQNIISTLNTKLAEGVEIDENPKTEEKPVEASAPGVTATDEKGNPVNIQFQANPGAIESPTITIGGAQVVTEDRFESVGPTIGQELKDKSVTAMIMVIIAIILYIAWAFRKVSEPVSSWKYGVTAVIALIHDVIIPTGVFAVLGRYAGIEVDILFVTALLTILGFSVNDTIVVFDRTRENLARDHWHHDFEWIVNKSVNETMRRSVFTSLTVFLILLAIYLFGGDSIQNFMLALMIGVVFGTYSSIFLASPLLVVWERLSRRRAS